MFIIGKNLKDCDEVVKTMIGNENINLINNYLANYYEAIYNNQDLKVKMENAFQAEKEFQNSCFEGIGMIPFLQFARFNSLANNLDSTQDQVNKKKKELQLSLSKLEKNNTDIKNSNVYERLEKSHNLHAFCKYMNPYIEEVTEEDLLLDQVLNNELDLIKDFLDDYRSFNFDIRLAKKINNYSINHEINKLDLRLQNVVIQHEILKIYQNSNQDAALINEIINESYGLLMKSFSERISTTEIKEYRDKMNFDIDKEEDLDKAIKKYTTKTIDDITNYGKITNNKKKVK